MNKLKYTKINENELVIPISKSFLETEGIDVENPYNNEVMNKFYEKYLRRVVFDEFVSVSNDESYYIDIKLCKKESCDNDNYELVIHYTPGEDPDCNESEMFLNDINKSGQSDILHELYSPKDVNSVLKMDLLCKSISLRFPNFTLATKFLSAVNVNNVLCSAIKTKDDSVILILDVTTAENFDDIQMTKNYLRNVSNEFKCCEEIPAWFGMMKIKFAEEHNLILFKKLSIDVF